MVFSDVTNKQGIVEEIDSLCDTDSTSYPLAAKLRRVNSKYEQIVGNLIVMNGTWQFDDSNYTTFPIGKGTLVASQNDYAFDSSHLVIDSVEVLDKNGIWHLLNPIDRQNLGVPIEEYAKTPGLPTEYDKSGSSLLLYPAPSAAECTLTNGLRVYFQRTASIFLVSDTTKTPGFASPYHIILAYAAAIPYCATYKKDRVALYQREMERLERDLYAFESNKEKDVRKRITFKGVCHM